MKKTRIEVIGYDDMSGDDIALDATPEEMKAAGVTGGGSFNFDHLTSPPPPTGGDLAPSPTGNLTLCTYSLSRVLSLNVNSHVRGRVYALCVHWFQRCPGTTLQVRQKTFSEVGVARKAAEVLVHHDRYAYAGIPYETVLTLFAACSVDLLT